MSFLKPGSHGTLLLLETTALCTPFRSKSRVHAKHSLFLNAVSTSPTWSMPGVNRASGNTGDPGGAFWAVSGLPGDSGPGSHVTQQM